VLELPRRPADAYSEIPIKNSRSNWWTLAPRVPLVRLYGSALRMAQPSEPQLAAA